jgi:twitching motility protein PilT
MIVTENLKIDQILNTLAERGATDIHFTVGNVPYFRVNGKLMNFNEGEVINQSLMDLLVNYFVPPEKLPLLGQGLEIRFAFDWQDKARFRVHVFQQKGYQAISLKIVPGSIKSFNELGLPKIINTFVQARKGLIIVSGPFDSGRSTTVAAIIEAINQSRSERIVYLEQPIEYLFVNQKSMIEQREVGKDVLSFTEGLESLKEEDVNVVVVSKIDSLESVELSLELAESGCLVIITMDFDSSASCLANLISDFPEKQKEWARNVLADYLVGLVVQKIVPGIVVPALAVEIMTVTSSTRPLISGGSFRQLEDTLTTSRGEGMVSLDYSLASLVKLGKITTETAIKYANNPKTFNLIIPR